MSVTYLPRRLSPLCLAASCLLIIFSGCGSRVEPDGQGPDTQPVGVGGTSDASDVEPAAETEIPEGTSEAESTDGSSNTAGGTELSEDFYTVASYDIEADPAVQLEATLKRAKLENKTVLLQVGGDWCGWCKLMTKFFASNGAVNELLNRGFVLQKVTFEEKNRNEAFLSKYPPINGYPHLFVLDSDGKMLHSQNTAWLEAPAKDGMGYSQEKLTEFLERWLP